MQNGGEEERILRTSFCHHNNTGRCIHSGNGNVAIFREVPEIRDDFAVCTLGYISKTVSRTKKVTRAAYIPGPSAVRRSAQICCIGRLKAKAAAHVPED